MSGSGARSWVLREPEPPRYWCADCGEQGVPSLRDGAVCLLCGAEQYEPFRVGWDESD